MTNSDYYVLPSIKIVSIPWLSLLNNEIELPMKFDSLRESLLVGERWGLLFTVSFSIFYFFLLRIWSKQKKSHGLCLEKSCFEKAALYCLRVFVNLSWERRRSFYQCHQSDLRILDLKPDWLRFFCSTASPKFWFSLLIPSFLGYIRRASHLFSLMLNPCNSKEKRDFVFPFCIIVTDSSIFPSSRRSFGNICQKSKVDYWENNHRNEMLREWVCPELLVLTFLGKNFFFPSSLVQARRKSVFFFLFWLMFN